MQGNDRSDAAVTQSFEHGAVAANGAGIEVALFGLDAAPFDGKAKRVDTDFLGQIEIALGIAPPVASLAAGVSRI